MSMSNVLQGKYISYYFVHNSLFFREPGQGTVEEHKNKDFRRELEERERLAVR